jgi:hypothetical protein
MSEAHQKYLCDAVAAVNDSKLFITVYRVNDGIDFASGHGETKHGSPRRHWTPDLIKREIAMVYGAKTVELVQPVSSSRRRSR